MDLNTLRSEIDGINEQLLTLFERRMALSREVAAYKMEHGMEIFVPAREVAILDWVEAQTDPELREYALNYFNCILQESRNYQRKLIAAAHVDAAGEDPNAIHTERLLLLPLESGDARPVFSLTSNPRITLHLRFETHTTISQTELLIADYTTPPNHAFKVIRQEDGAFVGVFALKPDKERPQEVRLLAFLEESMWGNGYFSEILQAAKAFARDEMHGQALTGDVEYDNLRSRQAMERAGFTLDRKMLLDDWDGQLYIYRFDLRKS